MPSMLAARRWPRSSSTYCTCAMWCAKSEPRLYVRFMPLKRDTVVAVAFVNSVPAGGGVSVDGLFGLTFNAVRSVLQAVAVSALSATRQGLQDRPDGVER